MMNDYIVPVLLQVFERQSAVAMLGGCFAAQEDGPSFESLL
jgi:hypothetical protein